MTSATATATNTFNDAVKYALERVGKAGMVLKSKQVELFVVCTKERMCLYFYQQASGRLSASKC